MADKTRSGVEAGVFNVLFVLNSGVVKELLNSTTNVTPALLDDAGCLMVDMAVAEWARAAPSSTPRGSTPPSGTSCVGTRPRGPLKPSSTSMSFRTI